MLLPKYFSIVLISRPATGVQIKTSFSILSMWVSKKSFIFWGLIHKSKTPSLIAVKDSSGVIE